MLAPASRLSFVLVAFIWLAGSALAAAEFSFYATLRAGRPSNGDWEMGLGNDSTASQSTGQFQWTSSKKHWRSDDLPQNFEIGYTARTNNAYVKVFDSTNKAWTTSYTNTGALLGSNALWTFPAANMFVTASASSKPTSINVDQMTLSSGVQILSGNLPSSLGATQGIQTSADLAPPLIINAASNGGNWFITGRIRFSGLVGSGGNAAGSDLQFLLRAMGSDANPTPETGTFLTVGCALVLGTVIRRKRSQPNP